MIFRLTSSTSSMDFFGRTISIRLLPTWRIAMSSTPSGLIRRLSAVIKSLRLTLPAAVPFELTS